LQSGLRRFVQLHDTYVQSIFDAGISLLIVQHDFEGTIRYKFHKYFDKSLAISDETGNVISDL